MLITSFSAIVLTLMALIIYKHVRRGYKRGLTRSLTGLSTVLFSVFFGALISIAVISAAGDALIELIASTGLVDGLTDMMMGYEGVIVLVLKMVMTLIIYIPVFSLVRLIVGVPVAITVRKLCGKRRQSTDYYKEGEELYVKRNKVIGACIGSLTGFIVSLVMLMPLVGIVKSADAVMDFAAELAEGVAPEEDGEIEGGIEEDAGIEDGLEEPSDEDEDASSDGDLKAIGRYADDLSVNIVSACGGRMIFNFATTVGGYGGYTSFNRELNALENIDIDKMLTAFSSIGSDDGSASAAIEGLIGDIKTSAVFEIILVETISGASEAWLSYDAYMGIERPDFGDYNAINTFLDELLYVCTSTTSKTIAADLRTLVGISDILTEKQSMFNEGDYDTIINDFAGGGLIRKLKVELQKNSHMYTVVYALDNLVMSVVAEEIQNTVKYSSESCEALFEEIADILTSTSDLTGSVRVSAVTESLKESLEEYGMEVPAELNEDVATQLIEGVENFDGEVRYEQVEEYFQRFLEEGGDISDLLPTE